MAPIGVNHTDPSGEWVGLGLQYGTVRLSEARPEWAAVARRLADQIRAALGPIALGVEHVGSTAVAGLAAKPIIDLAVGVSPVSAEAVREPLAGLGYNYRGDAGDAGGLVFVLDDRPQFRIAHLHVVEYRGRQWERYLTFRDLLLGDSSARAAYERVKTELASKLPNDRKAYTAAKDGIVSSLLEEHAARGR